MSLINILKEFNDPRIINSLIKQVNNFDGIDNMELMEDTPFSSGTAQAFVYMVENNKSTKFVLRVRRPSDGLHEGFDEFVDHDYDNIVKVYFHRTLSQKYEVTIMEYLPHEIRTTAEVDVVNNIFLLMHELKNREFENMLINETVSKYFFDKNYNLTNNKKAEKDRKDTLIKLYDVDNDARHLIDDIINALYEYYDATGEMYRDMHEGNIMRSKNDEYKLIDL